MDKFAPENRLRDHVAALAGRQCSQAELTEVMRLVRLVVENEGLAETYPHVSLYRDWLLHPEIDRHKLVLKRLEQMNEAIARYDQTGDIAIVSALFSLAVLRVELTVLFKSHQVKTELLDLFANWKTFVSVMLEDLCNRPLRLPKKPSGKMKKAKEDCIARMKSKSEATGKRLWARAAFITLDRTQDPAPFSWNVECEAPDLVGAKCLVFKSTLQMTETPKDFLHP